MDRHDGHSGRVARPALVLVSREPPLRDRVGEELGQRYGADYAVAVCASEDDLAAEVARLEGQGIPIAAFLAGLGPEDPDGLACPLGAHVRRANPRDALPPKPGSERSLRLTDHHRLLRRARNYSAPSTDGADGERGLFFLCKYVRFDVLELANSGANAHLVRTLADAVAVLAFFLLCNLVIHVFQ